MLALRNTSKLRPSQGSTCSLVLLLKNGLFPLFPKNKILIFYVPCSPKLPVFPLFLGLCSPENNCPCSSVTQNPWEGLKVVVKHRTLLQPESEAKLRQVWQHLSHDMTKPTMWPCAQRRLRSAWASAQSDQSLHCALKG